MLFSRVALAIGIGALLTRVCQGKTCQDTVGFEDEKGFTCSDWKGHACSAAASSYSEVGLRSLVENCRQTCGSCAPTLLPPQTKNSMGGHNEATETLSVGKSIDFWSNHYQQWFHGRVLKCHSDGSVDVTFSIQKTIPADAVAKLIRYSGDHHIVATSNDDKTKEHSTTDLTTSHRNVVEADVLKETWSILSKGSVEGTLQAESPTGVEQTFGFEAGKKEMADFRLRVEEDQKGNQSDILSFTADTVMFGSTTRQNKTTPVQDDIGNREELLKAYMQPNAPRPTDVHEAYKLRSASEGAALVEAKEQLGTERPQQNHRQLLGVSKVQDATSRASARIIDTERLQADGLKLGEYKSKETGGSPRAVALSTTVRRRSSWQRSYNTSSNTGRNGEKAKVMYDEVVLPDNADNSALKCPDSRQKSIFEYTTWLPIWILSSLYALALLCGLGFTLIAYYRRPEACLAGDKRAPMMDRDAVEELAMILGKRNSQTKLMFDAVVNCTKSLLKLYSFFLICIAMGHQKVELSLYMLASIISYLFTTVFTIFSLILKNYFGLILVNQFLEDGVLLRFQEPGFKLFSFTVPLRPELLACAVFSINLVAVMVRIVATSGQGIFSIVTQSVAICIPLLITWLDAHQQQDINMHYSISFLYDIADSAMKPQWLVIAKAEGIYEALGSVSILRSHLSCLLREHGEEFIPRTHLQSHLKYRSESSTVELAASEEGATWAKTITRAALGQDTPNERGDSHCIDNESKLAASANTFSSIDTEGAVAITYPTLFRYDWVHLILDTFTSDSYQFGLCRVLHSVMLFILLMFPVFLLFAICHTYTSLKPSIDFHQFVPGAVVNGNEIIFPQGAFEVQMLILPNVKTVRETYWCLESGGDQQPGWYSIDEAFSHGTAHDMAKGHGEVVLKASINIKNSSKIFLMSCGAYCVTKSFKLTPVTMSFELNMRLLDAGDSKLGRLSVRSSTAEEIVAIVPSGVKGILVESHEKWLMHGTRWYDWHDDVWTFQCSPPYAFDSWHYMVLCTASPFPSHGEDIELRRFIIRLVTPSLILDPQPGGLIPPQITQVNETFFEVVSYNDSLGIAITNSSSLQSSLKSSHACGSISNETPAAFLQVRNLSELHTCSMHVQIKVETHAGYRGKFPDVSVYSVIVQFANLEHRLMVLDEALEETHSADRKNDLRKLMNTLLDEAAESIEDVRNETDVNILGVGETGKGKTSECLWMTGNIENCEPSNSVDSATKGFIKVTGRAFNDSKQGNLTFIDTQGFRDTEDGNDAAVAVLKHLMEARETVDAINWVVHVTDYRFGKTASTVYAELRKIAGINLFDILSIVLNYCGEHTKKSEIESFRHMFTLWMVRAERSIWNEDYDLSSNSTQVFYKRLEDKIREIPMYPVDLKPPSQTLELRPLSQPYVSLLHPWRYQPGVALLKLYNTSLKHKRDGKRLTFGSGQPVRFGFGTCFEGNHTCKFPGNCTIKLHGHNLSVEDRLILIEPTMQCGMGKALFASFPHPTGDRDELIFTWRLERSGNFQLCYCEAPCPLQKALLSDPYLKTRFAQSAGKLMAERLKCAPPPHIDHADALNRNDPSEPVYLGESIAYRCHEGYLSSKTNQTSFELTCSEDLFKMHNTEPRLDPTESCVFSTLMPKGYVCLALGWTGSGKTTLCQYASNNIAHCAGSAGAWSDTKVATPYTFDWLGNSSQPVTFIDTPGWADSNDTGNAAGQFSITLRQVQKITSKVDIVLIVRNGARFRLDSQLQGMLDIFKYTFPELTEHAIYVYTHGLNRCEDSKETCQDVDLTNQSAHGAQSAHEALTELYGKISKIASSASFQPVDTGQLTVRVGEGRVASSFTYYWGKACRGENCTFAVNVNEITSRAALLLQSCQDCGVSCPGSFFFSWGSLDNVFHMKIATSNQGETFYACFCEGDCDGSGTQTGSVFDPRRFTQYAGKISPEKAHIGKVPTLGPTPMPLPTANGPWVYETIWNFTEPTYFQALHDHDTVALTSTTHSSNVPKGMVKMCIKCTADTWWKAITMFKGTEFIKEVAHTQDHQNETNCGLVEVEELANNYFALSKAKFLGVHVNMYHISNAADMKGGGTYSWTWSACAPPSPPRWKYETIWNFAKPTYSPSLHDHDTITLTSTTHSSNVSKGMVKMCINCTADTWWKAITMFKGTEFIKEVARTQDHQNETDCGLVEIEELAYYDFALSKAKVFGIHTDMYHITNAADMKGGGTYVWTWSAS